LPEPVDYGALVPDLRTHFGLTRDEIREMEPPELQMWIDRLPFAKFEKQAPFAKLGALILNAMGGKSKDAKEVDPNTVFSWLTDSAVLDLALPGTLEQVIAANNKPANPDAISITPGLARALEQAHMDKLLPSWVVQVIGGYDVVKTALKK
jgi:hypothetical protein